jgi:hypothetical protein
VRRLLVLVLAPLALLPACSGAPEVHDDPEPVGYASAELSAGDPVSLAVDQSCTTTSVKGLATQLVDEIQCLKPGSMASIASVPNTDLGSAVFPFLQTSAASALKQVAASRGTPLVINSGLRTLPQQYLLYRWYKTGRCGIGLAASPGTSNHESGLAVDVNDNAAWKPYFQSKGWSWLGASDPVHFDYVAGGIDLKGLSVLAFQRLWNRNHPTDKITEDGGYGPDTETRLAKSPVGGFAQGATCKDPPPPPDKDAGAPAKDAGAPADDAGSVPVAHDDASPDPATPQASQEGGCNVGAGGPGGVPWLAVAAVLLGLRRRTRSEHRPSGR